jgi:HrpA-like RNA helicase
MYAALPDSQLKAAFAPVDPTRRKIVVATNLAETSVTISNISHVIDSGRAKIK